MLVRQRPHGAVGASPLHQGSEPLTVPVILEFDPADGGTCSMDEARAEVTIPPRADPEQMRLTSSRMLAGDEAEPGGTRPTIVDVCRITERRDHGCRGERANARHHQEALAGRIGLTDRFQRFM
jgi:hypothetical protein